MKGIYKIQNKLNNKIYVGQSIDIERRFEEHKVNDSDYPIYRAFKKYGIENFEFSIIEETEDLGMREQHWIKFYESQNPSKGYNISCGGDAFFTGQHHTEESKQKIRNSMPDRKGSNNPMFGKNAFEGKTKEEMEIIGKKLSESVSKSKKEKFKNDPEFKQKMIGLIREVVSRPEVRKKMSDSAKDRCNRLGPPKTGFRDKRGDKNPIFGKNMYYNPLLNKRKYFLKGSEIPEGWIKGGVKHS